MTSRERTDDQTSIASTSASNSFEKRWYSASVILRQLASFVLRERHQPPDDPVRFAEGHALERQVVRKVGRQQVAAARRPRFAAPGSAGCTTISAMISSVDVSVS